jgi:hypothetical protein
MMLVASSPRQDVDAPISIPAHAIKALVAQLKESDRSLDAALNEVERRVRERPR